MAFNIEFMFNNEPMEKIQKTPRGLFTLSGDLRDESSIVDPVFLIEYQNPINANYAYIAEFQRYYYIRNITAVRTGLWRIELHTDVLKTFSEGILGSPCVVNRSSNRKNLYLNDHRLKRQQNEWVLTQNFPNGFNLDPGNVKFILALIGDKVQ